MSSIARRVAIGVSLALVVGAAVALALLRTPSTETTSGGPDTSSAGATTSAVSSSVTTTAPAPSTTTSTTTTTTTTLPTALVAGATGPAVTALQQRLFDLRFWLPAIDGTYDSNTTHAVVAFQKAAGLTPDGVAGPLTLEALQSAEPPSPRDANGATIEVDLTRQLLLLVVDGHVQWVFDTSTGAVAGTTPVGDYTVYRQVDGYDHGPLGTLYRPKYFVRGVAVHGFPSVPSHPASHGCVRVTNAAMDWLWANDAMPIGATVSVYR